MSEEAEKKILKIYDGSLPDEKDLFETSNVNHIAWTLAVLMAGLALWLGIALVNAENQRHALMTKQCADPVFKGDVICMQVVNSRPHWWNHLWYGMTHLKPAIDK
ncbi:MAG: hypothetical protein WKG03_04220 [Telluria sp.]